MESMEDIQTELEQESKLIVNKASMKQSDKPHDLFEQIEYIEDRYNTDQRNLLKDGRSPL
jgi:hypothetical protein